MPKKGERLKTVAIATCNLPSLFVNICNIDVLEMEWGFNCDANLPGLTDPNLLAPWMPLKRVQGGKDGTSLSNKS